MTPRTAPPPTHSTTPPNRIMSIPRFDRPVVELDVRDDLRQGREPFSRIMAAVGALGTGNVLHLRATFEPIPLFAAMAKRGFAYRAHAHEPGDWSVWFYRPEDAPTGEATPAPSAAAGRSAPPSNGGASTVSAAAEEVVLDVRGLEPPEPMVRTLEALERLPAGATLVQRNDRVPHFLLPLLGERGFTHEIDAAAPGGGVVVRIRRSAA